MGAYPQMPPEPHDTVFRHVLEANDRMKQLPFLNLKKKKAKALELVDWSIHQLGLAKATLEREDERCA